MSKRKVFEEIKARLQNGKTVLNDSTWKVPGTIMLWNNQLSNIEKEKSFRKPAVYVEFQDLVYSGRGRRTKDVSGILKLYILQKDVSDENLDVLDYVDQIARVLEGYQTDTITTALTRSGEIQDTDHDNLIVWEQDYILSFNDSTVTTMIDSTVIDAETIKPELSIDLDIRNRVIRTGKLDEIFNIQGLAHVWNADRLGSITFSGTKAASIKDINNKDGDISQAVGAKQPEVVDSYGHKALRFEGAQSMATAISLDKSAIKAIDIFMVISSAQQNDVMLLESSADSTLITDGLSLSWNDEQNIEGYVNGDVGASSAEASNPDKDIYLVNLIIDKSKPSKEVTIYINGLDRTIERDDDANNTNGFGDYTWYMGSRGDVSKFSIMDMFYTAVFDKILTSEERKRVSNSLMKEYGIEGAELLPLQP